jgi:hypothetical protein
MAPELEIGRFICPNMNSSAPLKAAQSVAFIHWPMLVKSCPACGQEHTLELKDVQHPPVYGYE